MICRGRYLGQSDSFISPGNKVTRIRDLDLGLVPTSLDRPGLMDLEQLRMERSSINLEE